MADEELDEQGRANVELRLKLLMAHAKFGGWIVEKKQSTRATLDVSKLLKGSGGATDRAQLIESFSAMLNQLQPGARRRLEAIAAAKAEPEESSPQNAKIAE